MKLKVFQLSRCFCLHLEEIIEEFSTKFDFYHENYCGSGSSSKKLFCPYHNPQAQTTPSCLWNNVGDFADFLFKRLSTAWGAVLNMPVILERLILAKSPYFSPFRTSHQNSKDLVLTTFSSWKRISILLWIFFIFGHNSPIAKLKLRQIQLQDLMPIYGHVCQLCADWLVCR